MSSSEWRISCRIFVNWRVKNRRNGTKSRDRIIRTTAVATKITTCSTILWVYWLSCPMLSTLNGEEIITFGTKPLYLTSHVRSWNAHSYPKAPTPISLHRPCSLKEGKKRERGNNVILFHVIRPLPGAVDYCITCAIRHSFIVRLFIPQRFSTLPFVFFILSKSQHTHKTGTRAEYIRFSLLFCCGSAYPSAERDMMSSSLPLFLIALAELTVHLLLSVQTGYI